MDNPQLVTTGVVTVQSYDNAKWEELGMGLKIVAIASPRSYKHDLGTW